MMLNIFLLTAVFLAYFIKSIVGFGNALILNSIFAFVKQTQFTTAIDLMLIFPINIYMVWRERKGLNIKAILPLILTTLLGSTLGIILLNISQDRTLKIILGIVIILTALKMVFKSDKAEQSKPIKTLVLAFGSGLLLGLYGIAALLAVQIQNIFPDEKSYRSNLCLILVIDNVYRLLGYLTNGIIDKTILIYSGYMFPIALLAVFCGSLIDKKINAEIIKKLVICLLLVSGLIIFITNIL